MPASMTGFGRAASGARGARLLCEARSVNHRFLAVKIRLPGALQQLESLVQQRAEAALKRGSVEVAVYWRDAGEQLASRIDVRVADRYLGELRAFLRSRRLDESVSAQLLLSLPGVLAPPDPDEISRAFKTQLARVVDEALAALVRMREREGARLARALRREVRVVTRCAERIRAGVPRALATHQSRLSARLQSLLSGSSVALDPQVVAREVAVLADKSDVTEELDRLESHEAEFERLLGKTGEAVGRQLEFLVQEMGREVQTVGSKLQHAELLALVRAAKASLEKAREQVANLE